MSVSLKPFFCITVGLHRELRLMFLSIVVFFSSHLEVFTYHKSPIDSLSQERYKHPLFKAIYCRLIRSFPEHISLISSLTHTSQLHIHKCSPRLAKIVFIINFSYSLWTTLALIYRVINVSICLHLAHMIRAAAVQASVL